MATGQPHNKTKTWTNQICQGYKNNRLNIKLRVHVIDPPKSLDPYVFICLLNIPHQNKLIANDTFDLIKNQIRSFRHICKDPCIPFLPEMIHYSCETQFMKKIDETLTMPSDSGPSNPFIPAFCHSWNVASVTTHPTRSLQYRSIQRTSGCDLHCCGDRVNIYWDHVYQTDEVYLEL